MLRVDIALTYLSFMYSIVIQSSEYFLGFEKLFAETATDFFLVYP